MKFSTTPNGYAVRCSVWDVMRAKRAHVGSRLPQKAITFEFDRHGKLTAHDASERGPAVVALAEAARAFLVADPADLPPRPVVPKNPHAVAMGRLGGSRRAQNMTPEQRRQNAAIAGKHAPGWPKGKPRGPRKPKQTAGA